MALEGRIQTRSWDDDRGVRHWKTEIVANHVEMLSGRKKKDYEAQAAADALETQAESLDDAPPGHDTAGLRRGPDGTVPEPLRAVHHGRMTSSGSQGATGATAGAAAEAAAASAAVELVDLGDGRRLERFGPYLLDRPCPPAAGIRVGDPKAWLEADAVFEARALGEIRHATWTTRDGRPIEPWVVEADGLRWELRLTASGQVGFFAEQSEQRTWLSRWATARPSGGPGVLNLFGYTGGSTLPVVAAGHPATHVDASRGAVAWARRNAELNDLGSSPVRWIADDALAFVRREVRRGRRYAGIVLDPPSYGHGAPGRRAGIRDWRIERDLPALLDDCAALLADEPGAFILLTAHSVGLGPERLGGALARASDRGGDLVTGELGLLARPGARLPLGAFARWTR